MHNVPVEEARNHVPLGALGAIHVYRLHTEFSQCVMDVVANIRSVFHGLRHSKRIHCIFGGKKR